MGDLVINCPFCCKKTFDTKEKFVEHLSEILSQLVCPICKLKLASLTHLIEHLSVDSCQQPSNTVRTETIIFTDGITNENYVQPNQNRSLNVEQSQNENLLSEDFSVKNNKTGDNADINKMYVEIMTKPIMKPCLQTQEIKLGNGESRYVILNPDSDLNSDNTIVTKQNNDGTISLTSIKDMKVESDTLITQVENEPEDNHDEIYSCNTCGVSFSSVIEHIQNYHNDQEVVVEEPIEDGGTESHVIEYDQLQEQCPEETQPPRRVITDSGDIIEAPVVPKIEPVRNINKLLIPVRDEVTDKQGRVYTRKYVQIDKFCDSVVKDINTSDDKKTMRQNHKVVVKEIKVPSGERVKVFNCTVCNIYVSTLDEFKTEPCKKLKYFCAHCPVTYDNSKSLCAHMKVHKVKSDEIIEVPITFECEVCSTTFPTNKSLKLHKRMHDPIKSRPIEPPIEAEGAINNTRFLCLVCDKMIPTNYREVHEESHEDSDKMNCDICNKKFHSKEYLDMHMSVHNMDEVPVNKPDKTLPYTCLYCNRQFARPHEKVKHERIHTGEKPHSCEICGKSFRVSYCLTLHMRTHTGARPYACPHCGKRFKANSVYNHHLLTHSEVRAYKCPYCPKAFKTSVQLAGHKNSHTKPFSCQQCNRPFASLYAVRVHTETHARRNNLKFSCSLCGASYARAFALKDHIKQVHKEKYVDSTSFREEDYMIRENTDTDPLSKDLKEDDDLKEIELGMSANELIVP